MNFINYRIEKLIILAGVVLLVCFGGLSAVEAEYYESGTLESQNLLEDLYTDNVSSFGYNATISANTSIQVQFGLHGEYGNWYSSDGTLDGWDTLSNGDYTAEGDAIDLSALGWTDPYFYYKASLTTTDTSSSTPVLNEARVYYEEGEAPTTTYETSGTLVSENILSGVEVDNVINGFEYNVSSIPAGTGLTVQFSQDNSTWYNSAGQSGQSNTLVQGSHLIDLTSLGWSGLNFYYKIEFTSDGNNTPVLDDVKVYYAQASVTDYPDPLRFGQSITFSAEWASLSLGSGVKLYVCKAADGTSSGCGAGGEWCSNSDDFETGKTIICSYNTVQGDIGSNDYYVYLCDASANCSSAASGAFTVQQLGTPAIKLEGGLKFKGGTKFGL